MSTDRPSGRRSLATGAGSPAVALLAVVGLALGLLTPTASHARPSAATSAARAMPSEAGWRADVREAMQGSRDYLAQRADGGGRRLAINLDIDNTALASHYDPGDATPPVLRFARHADRLDIAVLFNTARRKGDGNLRETKRVLRRAGYPVARICGRHRGESVVDGKQRCRRTFREQGYTLVANVGNRRTDFVGRGYERAYRLPSYRGRLS